MDIGIPNNRLYRSCLWLFVQWATWDFSFPGHNYVVCEFTLFISDFINWYLFRWYWNVQCCPVGYIIFVVFDFVGHFRSRFSTVMEFKWSDLSVLWIAKLSRLVSLVSHIMPSKSAIVQFFSVCTARSTTPVPVCSLGGLQSISTFLFFRNNLYSFDRNALPLSDFSFSKNCKDFWSFLEIFWLLFAHPNYGPRAVSINANKNIWITGYMSIMYLPEKKTICNLSRGRSLPVVWFFPLTVNVTLNS